MATPGNDTVFMGIKPLGFMPESFSDISLLKSTYSST